MVFNFSTLDLILKIVYSTWNITKLQFSFCSIPASPHRKSIPNTLLCILYKLVFLTACCRYRLLARIAISTRLVDHVKLWLIRVLLV